VITVGIGDTLRMTKAELNARVVGNVVKIRDRLERGADGEFLVMVGPLMNPERLISLISIPQSKERSGMVGRRGEPA
jgi:hypothetical protein